MVDNLKNVYYQALEKIGETVKKTVQWKLPSKTNKKKIKKSQVQEMLDSGMHEDEIVDYYLVKFRENKNIKTGGDRA